MFDKFLKEHEDFNTLKAEHGFATWKIQDDGTCYIRDIYVMPEFRKSGVGSEIADRVCEIAQKEYKSKKLIGSVSIKAKHADASIKVLHGYGMRFIGITPDAQLLIFEKEIK